MEAETTIQSLTNALKSYDETLRTMMLVIQNLRIELQTSANIAEQIAEPSPKIIPVIPAIVNSMLVMETHRAGEVVQVPTNLVQEINSDIVDDNAATRRVKVFRFLNQWVHNAYSNKELSYFKELSEQDVLDLEANYMFGYKPGIYVQIIPINYKHSSL